MKIKLIMTTPENLVGEMSKICYATKSLEEDGRDITSSIVHSHKHLAALRFAYATISITELSVAAQNQIVRSKHLDFMVQSKRYVSLKKGKFKFIMPENLNLHAKNRMKDHWETSIELYQDLISEYDIKKEDARAILPANTSTNMNITGNLQAFDSFFKLRCSKHAQHEVQTIAIEIWKLLSESYPKIFGPMIYDDMTLTQWEKYKGHTNE